MSSSRSVNARDVPKIYPLDVRDHGEVIPTDVVPNEKGCLTQRFQSSVDVVRTEREELVRVHVKGCDAVDSVHRR